MHDLVGVVTLYFIMLAMLLLPLYVARTLMPGAYRFLQRLTRRIGKPLMAFLTGALLMNQVKRRGWLHGLLVHVPLVCGLVTIVAGISTGTIPAILAGILCVAVAFVATRFLGTLCHLRSRRSHLPSWRR